MEASPHDSCPEPRSDEEPRPAVDGPRPAGEELRPATPANGAEEKPAKKDPFLEISLVVLMALFFALLLKTYVAEAYMIRGDSMEPTFKNQERVMVQKVFFDVERGDVIIFASKEDPTKDLIKRVIGLPGDSVEVLDGKVRLNGELLEESYTTPYRYRHNEVYGPRTIPANTFFVLGDNRPQSQDSRVFHEIPASQVKGKVILRWWPADTLQTF